jgi:hypothetical protein
MASENAGFVGAAWQTYSTAPSFTLSLSSGTKTVYFKVQNSFGESAVVSDTIVLSVPAVTSFKINGGAASTTNPMVKLNNIATNAPTQYMASENAGFVGAAWQTYSTAPSFTLSLSSGTKTVYFKARNVSGESPVVTDTISAPAPAVTTFDINSGSASTTNLLVKLNNMATNSPTHYIASEDPGFGDTDWKVYSTAPSFTLSSGVGTKTVYFRLKNGVDESPVVTDDILVAESTPVVTSLKINAGAASTANSTVTLNNTASNSPTHYMASEDSGFGGASWLPYSTAPKFTLSAGSGPKVVYFRVKNIIGESSPTACDDIVALGPGVTSFKINAGAASTANSLVTLNNTATNSPTHYKASEDPNFSEASWLTYSTVPKFTLSAGSGTKTVYFKTQNIFGESSIVSDTILLY